MSDDERQGPALHFPPGHVRFRWLDADGNEVEPEFAGLAQPIIELTPPPSVTIERPWQPSDAQVEAHILGRSGGGHGYLDLGVEHTEDGHWRRTFVRDDIVRAQAATEEGPTP